MTSNSIIFSARCIEDELWPSMHNDAMKPIQLIFLHCSTYIHYYKSDIYLVYILCLCNWILYVICENLSCGIIVDYILSVFSLTLTGVAQPKGNIWIIPVLYEPQKWKWKANYSLSAPTASPSFFKKNLSRDRICFFPRFREYRITWLFTDFDPAWNCARDESIRQNVLDGWQEFGAVF